VHLKDGAKLAGAEPSVESMQKALKDAGAKARYAADEIADSQVQSLSGVGGGEKEASFEIVTRATSRELVGEALMSTLRDALDIQPKLSFQLRPDPAQGGATYFPITNEALGKVIGDPTVPERARDAIGGVGVVVENLNPPQTVDALSKRL